MFVDKVKVSIKAGDGGGGYISFRNEKYINKGGPDGGDGGRGGNVIVEASTGENTLNTFRYDKRIEAEPGKNGFRRNQHGKNGKDLVIKLPVGTVITDSDGNIRGDLTQAGQKLIIARGGSGGFGNAHFVSSTRQAPKFAEKGEPGEAYEALLELKLIADAGLIGLPNAGKSTFLSVVSNARPEIANYPFTTTSPNLGVAELSGKRSLLLADIPGLIEGAAEGKGLGDEFLKHIERTPVLIHCVDAYSNDIVKDYLVVRSELKKYGDGSLSKRPELVFVTKIDGLDDDVVNMQIDQLKSVTKKTKVIPISASAHTNLKASLEAIYELVRNSKVKEAKKIKSEPVIIKPDFSRISWQIDKIDETRFRVTGREVERFVLKTDLDNDQGLRRLRDILRKKGITHALKRAGATSGSKIIFGRDGHSEIEL